MFRLFLNVSRRANTFRREFSSGGKGFGNELFRKSLNKKLKENLFYIASYEIYGSVIGLLDYGPPGCVLKSNVLKFWRQHFVIEESMLEVDCTSVTLEAVLKASGHVDKFTDVMVIDQESGEFHRADHLLKDYCMEQLKNLTISDEKAAELKKVLALLEDFSTEQLGAKIKEYGITSPVKKNPLSDPFPFNLMFKTSIGPSGSNPGYMRPETAQGIFMHFRELYKYNGSKLPFAVAQIGQVFRNEISPRHGLLRLREFPLAEIEHFVDPEDKSHPRFSEVAELKFLLFPRGEQMSGQSAKKLCLGQAVAEGTVNNETLGYFIGRVYLFLTSLGIDKKRLRFRQHLPNEMAHYAADCWDAEIESSYGWIECVRISDRAAYDLKAHSKTTGKQLVAREIFAEPREVEKLVIAPVKKEMGIAFKGIQKNVLEALQEMNEKEALGSLDKKVTITKNMVSISKEKKKEHQRVFTPSVIEPSFGIGRIIYCLYEHCFKAGEVFRFPPLVAPVQCRILPLFKNQKEAATLISKELWSLDIANQLDATGSLWKRYERSDEMGVPITIALDAVSVTVRDRDTKERISLTLKEAVSLVISVVKGEMTWPEAILAGNMTDAELAVASDKGTKQVNLRNKDVKATEDDSDDSDEDAGDEKEKKAIAEGDSSHEDDSSEDDEGDSSEEGTPKKPEEAKKRSAEVNTSKSTASNKKAFVTPQKTTETKKPYVHVATPYPSKQASKGSGNSNGEESKQQQQQQTPKSAGAFECKSCKRTFTTEMGLQSHTKAKHSAAA